jgi:hypothetical protein
MIVGSTLLLMGTPLTTICSVAPLPVVTGLAEDVAVAGETEELAAEAWVVDGPAV